MAISCCLFSGSPLFRQPDACPNYLYKHGLGIHTDTGLVFLPLLYEWSWEAALTFLLFPYLEIKSLPPAHPGTRQAPTSAEAVLTDILLEGKKNPSTAGWSLGAGALAERLQQTSICGTPAGLFAFGI